jgi:CopG family nickel-responsive transcriptional regulator
MHAHTMEVILVQGPAARLQLIAGRLVTCRGVTTGKLQLTTAIIPQVHPLPDAGNWKNETPGDTQCQKP